MALILDSAPLVAALDRDDPNHDRCMSVLTRKEDLILLPTVLVEVDYFLRKWGGLSALHELTEDLSAGIYRLEQLTVTDIQRANELQMTYADLDLGIVDASIIAVCERLGEVKVATLDHRHFSIVRPKHCERLELLPA